MTQTRKTAAGRSTRDLNEIIAEGNRFLPDRMTVIDNGEGPTILVCGGIHGDEYEPQVVLRRLAREIDPSTVTGRLIIIPAINFPGSQKGSRLSTIDDANMNRTFPGDANGTQPSGCRNSFPMSCSLNAISSSTFMQAGPNTRSCP